MCIILIEEVGNYSRIAAERTHGFFWGVVRIILVLHEPHEVQAIPLVVWHFGIGQFSYSVRGNDSQNASSGNFAFKASRSLFSRSIEFRWLDSGFAATDALSGILESIVYRSPGRRPAAAAADAR